VNGGIRSAGAAWTSVHGARIADGGFGRTPDPSGTGRRLRPSARVAGQDAASAVVGSETDRNGGFGRRFRTERVWSSVSAEVRVRRSGQRLRPPVGSGNGSGRRLRSTLPGPDGPAAASRPRSGSADQVDGFTAGGRVWKRITATASAGAGGPDGSGSRPRGRGSGPQIRSTAARPAVGSGNGSRRRLRPAVEVRTGLDHRRKAAFRSAGQDGGPKAGGRIWKVLEGGFTAGFRSSQVKS